MKLAEEKVEEMKKNEEQKAEKQWEQDILSGLHLNATGTS